MRRPAAQEMIVQEMILRENVQEKVWRQAPARWRAQAMIAG